MMAISAKRACGASLRPRVYMPCAGNALLPSPLWGGSPSEARRGGGRSCWPESRPPTTTPTPNPSPRKSGLPDLRNICAEPGQARVPWGGEPTELRAVLQQIPSASGAGARRAFWSAPSACCARATRSYPPPCGEGRRAKRGGVGVGVVGLSRVPQQRPPPPTPPHKGEGSRPSLGRGRAIRSASDRRERQPARRAAWSSRQKRLCWPARLRWGMCTIFWGSATAVPMRWATRPWFLRIESVSSASAGSTT